MPTNFPGPYEVRISYDAAPASGVKLHEFRFSCNVTGSPTPGVTVATLEATNQDGVDVNLQTWVDDFVDLIAEIFTTTSTFNTAELWEYAPGTFNATWLASWTLGVSGLSASPALEDAQTIMTFRTTAGGFGKLDFRNSIFGSVVTAAFPSGNTAADDIMTYAAGIGTIIVGRDGGYFIVPINLLRGQNERMFRNRLRP